MKTVITKIVTATLLLSSIGLSDDIALSDVEAQYSDKSSVSAGEKLKQSINLGFSNTAGNTDTLT